MEIVIVIKCNIDPVILLTRLTALAQSVENIKDDFIYELTHEPTAWFKEGSMRKPQKSKLRKYLLAKHPLVNSCEI